MLSSITASDGTHIIKTCSAISGSGFSLLTGLATALFISIGAVLGRRDSMAVSRKRDTSDTPEIASALLEQRVMRSQNEALTQEIRQRKNIEAQLRHLAYHDIVTGLPNRALLLQCLTEHLASHAGKPAGSCTTVLCISIEGYKAVCDMLGRQYGDHLLVDIAGRIESQMNRNDEFGRLDGDEFLVVLRDRRDLAECTKLARRLLAFLEEPIFLGGVMIPITASIGLCEVTRSYRFVDEVLRDSDTAMIRAKREGGSRVIVYDETMSEDLISGMQSKLQLKNAIEAEQFVNFYQPLIDLKDRSIYGMEALIRWQHPDRGLLAPGAFIQLAEETGHIISMGSWCLRQACKDLKSFQRLSDRELTMSINVSTKQLDVPGYLDELFTTIDECGVNPNQIQLEITESIFLKDAARMGELFSAIRARNVKIAFDDFGTGYSSLSYLERYPVDTLKLDQSFVRKMADSPVNRRIVRLILNLAEAVGMSVTAEGIEEDQHAQQLVNYGCGFGQGYLFSKPVPRDVMQGLLLRSSEKHPHNLVEAC